jgi:hypothetical protein
VGATHDDHHPPSSSSTIIIDIIIITISVHHHRHAYVFPALSDPFDRAWCLVYWQYMEDVEMAFTAIAERIGTQDIHDVFNRFDTMGKVRAMRPPVVWDRRSSSATMVTFGNDGGGARGSNQWSCCWRCVEPPVLKA